MATDDNSNILGGKPITNARAVEICDNIYYRRESFNPTRKELKLCREVMREGKLIYRDQYEKLVEMAIKYNLI